ncbi:hypothetical protein DEEACLCL_00120 [Salmonella phage CRW-SP2]|nr:hypothetical protein DEEACLCL_00120 [Salmonella phage CRW-SP2]
MIFFENGSVVVQTISLFWNLLWYSSPFLIIMMMRSSIQ